MYDSEIIYTFFNTHTVIIAERALLAIGLNVKVRPVPSSISESCGLCLCVDSNLKQAVKDEFTKRSVEFAAVYSAQGGEFKKLTD